MFLCDVIEPLRIQELDLYKQTTVIKQWCAVLTYESITFNISCWVDFVFTLNLVPERLKYVLVKCVFKPYAHLLSSNIVKTCNKIKFEIVDKNS